MQENITLKIGFWFGEKTPSLQPKDILTATLSMEHLLRDYEDFEAKYREFKKEILIQQLLIKTLWKRKSAYYFYQNQ